MRLEPLYRARFSAPQSWSVELSGPDGTEGQNFLLTEGRCEGRVAASWRGANYPRRRTDGTLTPDFRGVLETDDKRHDPLRLERVRPRRQGGMSQLIGGMTHTTDDERYLWLNDTFCAVAGEVHHRPEDDRVEVVLDVFELVWETLAE